jgi:hypothetical protein
MFSAQSKFSETPRLAGDARAHYCSGDGRTIGAFLVEDL